MLAVSRSNALACCCRDIAKLWKLAGQRRKASAQQLRNTLGPDFSLWDDFPEEIGQARLALSFCFRSGYFGTM